MNRTFTSFKSLNRDSSPKDQNSEEQIEILDLSSDCSFIYQQLAEKGLLDSKSITYNKIAIFFAFFSITIISDIIYASELSTFLLFKSECFNFFSSSYENCLIPQICKNSSSASFISCYGTKQECHSYFTSKAKTISAANQISINNDAQNVMIRTEQEYIEQNSLSEDVNICENNKVIRLTLILTVIGEIAGIIGSSLIADSNGRKATLMWFYRIVALIEIVCFPFTKADFFINLHLREIISFFRGFLIHSTRHLITISFLETNPDVTKPYIDYFQIIYLLRASFISTYLYAYFGINYLYLLFFLVCAVTLYVILENTYVLESLRYLTEMRDEKRLLEGIKEFCVNKKGEKKLKLTALAHSGGQLPAEVEKNKLIAEIQNNFGFYFILEAVWEKELRKHKFWLRMLIWGSFDSIYYFIRIRVIILYLSSSSLRFDLMIEELVLSYLFVYIGGFIVQQFGGKKILISFMVFFTLLLGFSQMWRLQNGEGYLLNYLSTKKKAEIATDLGHLLVLKLYLVIICKQIFEMETIISLPSLYRSTITGIMKVFGMVVVLINSLLWDFFEGDEDYAMMFVLIVLFAFMHFQVFEGKDALFEFDLLANKEFIMGYSLKSPFNYILKGRNLIKALRFGSKSK